MPTTAVAYVPPSHTHNVFGATMWRKCDLTVGISISLTGKYARQGLQALQGAQLWAERAGVQLVYYDDESRSQRSADNARRLLEQDRVSILFGPYSSGLARRVADVAEHYQRVMWNHGGSSDDVASRFVVSTPTPASWYFRRLPAWLVRNAPGERTITVMYSRRGTFARHVVRGLSEEAEAFGLSVEVLRFGDVASQTAGVLVLAGSFEEELDVIRSRPKARFVGAVAAGVRAFAEALGPLAEGVIGPSQWEPSPETEWFFRSFQERFGDPPEYTAAGAYATGLVVEECIRRAGEVDDRRLREIATELDFETFFGWFRIDPPTGRQIGHAVLLVRWEGRQRVVLDPEARTSCACTYTSADSP